MGLLEKINKEKGTTILLTTTDLYEKLPTNRDYILKEGLPTQTKDTIIKMRARVIVFSVNNKR